MSRVTPALAERVVNWLDANGPKTYHEIAAGLGLSPDFARVTCCTLANEGFLRRTGKIPGRTRPRTLWGVA